MLQHPQLQVALKESNLTEENQLGVPLRVYRLKAKMIYLARIYSWIALIGWIASLLITLFSWQRMLALSTQPTGNLDRLSNTPSSLIQPLAGAVCLFVMWLLVLLVQLPAMKKMRVIVCENGLLQVRGRIQGHSIDVARWGEIELLVFGPYRIRVSLHFKSKERKPLNIREDY